MNITTIETLIEETLIDVLKTGTPEDRLNAVAIGSQLIDREKQQQALQILQQSQPPIDHSLAT